MMDPFAKEIVRELESKREAMRAVVCRGLPETEYWRCVGFLQGLEAIEVYVKDLANRVERDDDN